MGKIVSIHSFRGGTGKSNTTANVATLLAADGLRVGVADTDLQSPGIHTLFGHDQSSEDGCLNDYLWNGGRIADGAHDVTPDQDVAGRVWLLPASIRPNDIARLMREGYDVNRLNEGFRELIGDLSLDVLILDTHPGLNEETLLSIAMSNTLAIVLRPDEQDYEGTEVTVQVARKLGVPRMFLVVNNVPASFAVDEVGAGVADAYGCEVAAVLPHSEELMALSSGGIFALRYPDHPVTALYREVAAQLVA